MQILYITNLPYPSNAANGIQITETLNGFRQLPFVSDVVLLAPGDIANNVNVTGRIIVDKSKGRICRYLLLYLKFIIRFRSWRKDDVVFTRDPFFILIRLLRPKTAIILELHKQVNVIFWFLFNILNINVVRISEGIKPLTRCKSIVAHDAVKSVSVNRRDTNRLIGEFPWITSPLKKILHTGSVYKGSLSEFIKLPELVPDFLFVHVGGSSSEIDEIRRRVGDRHNLILLPHIEHEKVRKLQLLVDYLFYYNNPNSVIAKYTSPLKLFEYIDAGKRIVGNNYGSVEEILKPGTFIPIPDFVDGSYKKNDYKLEQPVVPFSDWVDRCYYIISHFTNHNV